MRFLGCFSRSNAVFDTPPRSLPDKQHQTPTSTNPNPSSINSNFVPSSIPELHPEYAHSEPYCFAARTDSARLLVEKQRAIQSTNILNARAIQQEPEQPVVVVRGPSYKPHNSSQPRSPSKSNPSTPTRPPRPVSLKVESPTTFNENFIDSDDSLTPQDENADLNRSNHHSSRSPRRKSSVSSTAMSPTSSSKKSRSKKNRKKSLSKSKSSFRIRSKSAKSVNSRKRSKTINRSSRHSSDPSISISDAVVSESVSRLPASATNSTIPSPPASDFDEQDMSLIEDHIKPHLDNTPAELLAPIRVPRMSHAFSHKPSASPVLSNDSWGPQDSSSQRRYEDVEGDNSSSGLVSFPPVGKGRVVHKANYPSRAPEFPLYAPPSPLHGSSPSGSNTLRAKRKSKPYLLSDSATDNQTFNPPVTIDERVLPADLPVDSLPALSPSKRPMPSADPAPTMEYSRPSPAKQAAARDRVRSDESFPPPMQSKSQSKIQPQSIMRRSTSNKRKTVSFHTAAPTIIEPNTRAPSYSVPRTALLSKEDIKPELPIKQRPALRKARDSVKIASSSIPRSFDTRDDAPSSTEQNSEDDSFAEHPSTGPTSGALLDFRRPEALQTGAPRRSATQNIAMAASSAAEDNSLSENRNMSDFSAGSDESFIARASRRMSTRIVKDRQELKEASKRQSKAVAEAMASQIRGVPKSAMLAYSENDIVLAESFEDDDSSRVSLRRKSRQVKSVRMPEFTPGVVPKPPPPPPFAPPPPRTKSWRQPPPPPVSPLPQ
ncbi:hypothetical protein BWQ96_05585 [Gracilariopsis chorda]|uniref:Uncharacterized protein n=1 Tax=Gracilariopsis chorda TaxID=448386 RepID=A0A2V3IRB7_9FLOR|nr:hypothetical protein BWQ96_05585 [Gracilariopsis chorda]|eukprot:PXF44643.1 hypothetical protein BWQ96_05585 [Gracilariopsis chorda]